MICPNCTNHGTQVIDSREANDSIRRRRECLACKHRFTTYERIEAPVITVLKKNGERERFKPEKVQRSIKIACKNRPIDAATIESLVRQVESSVMALPKDEVTSQQVGALVRQTLKEVDEIAYIRFVSVYEAFSNLDQFTSTINSLDTQP
jgi:transcriptional repressor NrdR